MARWTFAGGVGVVSGRLLWPGSPGSGSAGASSSQGSRSSPSCSCSASAARRSTDAASARGSEALRAIRRREVFRWLFLLELSDLLGDVLLGFLALYFVDAVGTARATGGLAVVVWSGAGLPAPPR